MLQFNSFSSFSTQALVRCQDSWPLSCEWPPAHLLSFGTYFFFFAAWKTHFAAHKLKPAHISSPHQQHTDWISASSQDHDDQTSMAAVMVLGERAILVMSGSRSLPWCSQQASPSGLRSAERNNMTETRRVAEVASSQRSGVIFFMKQSWWTGRFSYFGIDIHAPRLGNQAGRELKYFEQVLPCCNGWIFSCRRAWALTYGKMEAGAEASPQQHPRRKPVLHCLEDQKRVS